MHKKILWLSLCIVAFAVGCKNDNDCDDCNEQELITTLQLRFVNPISSDTASTRYFTFSDPDGDGGNNPSISTDTLESNTAYLVNVSVLDESQSPSVDLTSEILAEHNDHQFFYTVSSGLALSVDYNDTDNNGLPVGLNLVVNTSSASNGQLLVTLKHQPGIKDNNINTGDTDISVNFPVVVE